MSSSSSIELKEALQDLKEAFLLRITKRLISGRIADHQVIALARTLPAPLVVRKLKRAYLPYYLVNKAMRRFR